jgi:hypothetical protein
MSRYSPMNAEYKARWLDALRFGGYEQTTNALKTDVGMCCLGVLCDVVDPKGWERIENGYCGPSYRFRNEGQFPPKEIQKEAGLNMPKCERLADMNDVGAPFTEIADFIEKHF